MARPMICRKVSCDVTAKYFKPQGIPMRFLEEIAMELDEIEAIRLADLEGLYQVDAAARMGVSRQTFGNIIARAHKKVDGIHICVEGVAKAAVDAATVRASPVNVIASFFICNLLFLFCLGWIYT